METKFDENIIKSKIDQDVKNMSIIKDMFAKFSKIENDSSNSKQGALNLMNSINEENDLLKDINKNFFSTLSEIEKEKKNFIETINNTIIEAASTYPERVKDHKLKITNLKDLRKQKEKTTNEINKAKNKNETDTVNKLNAQLNDKLANEAKDIKNLEEQIMKNESDRVTDNKYMYLHYIHSALAYHCTSMQILTKLFSTINATDPKEDLNKYHKKYNISTYREEELPKLFNYIVGNTQRKLEAIKNPNIIPISNDNLQRNTFNPINPMNSVNPMINPTSPGTKNLNVNMIMDNDQILTNFNNQGNKIQFTGQNNQVMNQQGLYRGQSGLPRNTINSTNIGFTNK